MAAAKDEFSELMRNKDRRTRHPEDDDARSFLNMSDEDDNDVTPPATAVQDAPRSSTSTIPSRRYGANTGPKGVISDAQDYRDSRRSQRTSMRSTSSFAAHTSNLKDIPTMEKSIDEGDEHELDPDDENSFMKKWRQSRLRELHHGLKSSKLHENGSKTRLFGKLTMVDPDGYLDAVEGSGPDTVVIVYIYDDYSDVSDLFEACIRKLASQHRETRFIKLHYADAEMEPMGVPAVIAYRNGDKFAGLVPLINEMPDDAELDTISLESLFKRHQILR